MTSPDPRSISETLRRAKKVVAWCIIWGVFVFVLMTVGFVVLPDMVRIHLSWQEWAEATVVALAILGVFRGIFWAANEVSK